MAKKKTKKAARSGRIQLKIGRPESYSTGEEFREQCVKYFKALKFWNMPNIAGLCVFLGISRETWYAYRKTRKEFSDTIRNVEYLIESVWLDRLPRPGGAGVIFYLKNKFPEMYRDRVAGESADNPLYTKQITGMRVVSDKK